MIQLNDFAENNEHVRREKTLPNQIDWMNSLKHHKLFVTINVSLTIFACFFRFYKKFSNF